ncbi:hypothetical protein DRN69_05075 [Candidatus Pacearchaeota archaeon]|nr:MAG: hypothetical protein DRN69_05075 [Candidatus Pacearchaeota archaeon]
MKRVLLFILLSLICISTLSTVNAQWEQLVPSPPDMTSTPLKEGDFMVYKFDVAFEGLNFSEILNYYMNNTINPETLSAIDMYVAESVKIIESIEYKITVDRRSNNSITFHISWYYNETIRGDYYTHAIPLNSSSWRDASNQIQTIFPYVRPPNDKHDSILAYIKPLIDNFTQTVKLYYPNLDVSNWFTVTTSELSDFYCGQYRTVNRLYIVFPNIKSRISELITYFNVTLNAEQQQLFERLPECTIEYYIDWDKEFGVFLGQKLSIRLSTISWFSYKALKLYAVRTNLWEPNLVHAVTYTVSSFFTSYSENLVTYAVEGFVFGNESSVLMFIVYLIIPIIIISVVTILIKKRFK